MPTIITTGLGDFDRIALKDKGKSRDGFWSENILLIAGPPGSYKSTIAYRIIESNSSPDLHGLYFLFEQTKENLWNHLREIGFNKTDIVELIEFPFVKPGGDFPRGDDKPEYVENLNKFRDAIKQVKEGTVIAIDSFSVLDSFCNFENHRDALQSFINLFREKKLTVVLIWERKSNTDYHPIFYYVDGIFSLYKWLDGDSELFDRDTIVLKIDKMRAINHDRKFFNMKVVNDKGPKFIFSVGNPTMNKLGKESNRLIR